jgi:DNA-binding MarR family transcriptional regulator
MDKPSIDLQGISLELLLATGQFVRRLRQESATNELSWTQLASMARPASQGPATVADVAHAEMLRPRSMCSAISSLEEQGMVRCQAHAIDGRQCMFGLTQAGIETRATAASPKLAWLTATMTNLSPTEQETLAKTAALISHIADA